MQSKMAKKREAKPVNTKYGGAAAAKTAFDLNPADQNEVRRLS